MTELCSTIAGMAMLQVRNVPDDVYATLRERARNRGISVSEYVRGVLARDAVTAPLDQFLPGVRARSDASPNTTKLVDRALREIRDSGE